MLGRNERVVEAAAAIREAAGRDPTGLTDADEVLVDTAERDVGLLTQEDTTGLSTGPVDLDGTTTLTRGYEAGNILALEYRRGEVPAEEDLETDLTRLLALYQALIEARDQVQADEGDAEDPSGVPRRGTEAKRYRWHRRAERSPSLAREAKNLHGTRCHVEACGKRLSDRYGEPGEGYIEAHHLTRSPSSMAGPPSSTRRRISPSCAPTATG